MKKTSVFPSFDWESWPTVEALRPFFFGPIGQEKFPPKEMGDAGFSLEGVDGTSHLKLGEGRSDLCLDICGVSGIGAQLFYYKRSRKDAFAYASKGDMSRRHQYVRTVYGDLRPVGLFIPFAEAWKAVKEFLETDGQHLPRSIEWIDCRTFNKDTFPEPWANVEEIDIPTP